jgi:hypothetical protein
MAAEIILYNDILNNKLVRGLTDNGEFTMPPLVQYGSYALKVYPVYPTKIFPPSFAKVNISGMTLTAGIGVRAGNESLYAYQGTFALNTTEYYFYGNLDCNTSEMNTAIGTSDSISTYFELRLTESGVARVTYQTAIKVYGAVDHVTAGGTLPTAAANYLTREECLAMFVKFVGDSGDAGKTIALISPDGTKQRIIGVNDDGSAKDDLV